MSILNSSCQKFDLSIDHLSSEFIFQESVELDTRDYSGLYFLLQDNEIVYVGKSDTLIAARIAKHIKDSNKVFNRYFIAAMPSASQTDLIELESQAIAKFCPKYNRRICSSKTHALKLELETKYGISTYLSKKLMQKGLLTPIGIERSIIFLREEIESAIEWCKSNKNVGTETERHHCAELLKRQPDQGRVKGVSS